MKLKFEIELDGTTSDSRIITVSDKQSQTPCHSFTKQFAPDGIYIFTESGQLILPKFWGNYENSEEAKYIAFVKGDMKRMIALKGSDEGLELLEDGVKVALEEYSSIDAALKDNSGYSNTEKLLKVDSKVAEFCKELGKEWYLPAIGEMNAFYTIKKEVDAALAIAGGEPFFYGWHWTSTRYSSCRNWVYLWGNGNRDDDSQGSNYRVRPVSAF